MPTKPKILGDLLRSIRQRLELSIPDMAAKVKVNKNTLGDYEREARLPDMEFLAVFAKVSGWDLGKLVQARMEASQYSEQFQSAMRSIRAATDAAALFAVRRSSVSARQFADIQVVAYEKGLDIDGVEREFGAKFPMALSPQEPHAGYAYIPLLDVRAAAGGGALVDSENQVDVLAFKKDWIRQELHVSSDNLRLIYVEGDSMEPDLRAGDIVLIDHTDISARREGIYVLRMDGALLVKMLQRLPGGIVKVISRNTAYESFTVMAAELESGNGTAIIGRVVWACRRF